MTYRAFTKTKTGYLLLFLILIAVSYTVGTWNGKPVGKVSADLDGKEILYYHCPMHPGFQSDRPGVAPCCGMELEPVYAGDDGSQAKNSLPPGVLQIRPEIRQVIGVRTAVVKKTRTEQTLRLLGKVTADELRVYKIRATVDGWIQQTFPITVGDKVEKGQPLASFYSPDFLGPEQNYIIALINEEKNIFPDQWRTVQSYEDTLRGFGMDADQVEQIKKTRKISRDIVMRSPATGVVLLREVSPGYRFLKGEELYRVAELDRLWIYADLYEDESRFIRTGSTAEVIQPQLNKRFRARVSDVLPQFDPATRTMKVRLEADNPDYVLLPDMFVDVEFPLHLPSSLAVPAEAVLYSGTQAIVFVDLGDNRFEPRKVETGWRMNNRVEIVEGLEEGETIVVSGNFLLDSESRLQGLASGYGQEEVKDPVCDMTVDPSNAETLKSNVEGRTYYFCSKMCKDAFDANPDSYISHGKSPESGSESYGMKSHQKTATPEHSHREAKAAPVHAMTSEMSKSSAKTAKDPVCGMTVDPSKPETLKSEYKGRFYYFCASACKTKFDQNPEKYAGSASGHHE
jgi:Cu(I)/Ag(I) efflux system membrane fusion protein